MAVGSEQRREERRRRVEAAFPGNHVEAALDLLQDGLDASRARGRNGGRKSTLTAAAIRQIQAMYDSGEHTVEQIAAAFKTTRPTIYRALDPDSVGKKATAPGKSATSGSAA